LTAAIRGKQEPAEITAEPKPKPEITEPDFNAALARLGHPVTFPPKLDH
jgi:hypothetical protein